MAKEKLKNKSMAKEKLTNKEYAKELVKLQGKLCLLQEWVKARGCA